MSDSQRTALVTGASRGLGLGLVTQLLDNPGVVAVHGLSRDPGASDGLTELRERHGDRLRLHAVDLCDDAAIAALPGRLGATRLHVVINAAGVLHSGGARPEKRLEHVSRETLRAAFDVNAFAPLLMAQALLPLLRHDERCVYASISARVGSIGDNRLGGWYGYRASKAAQNMVTKTLSIELARRAKHVICVALHPGTVDTDLSRPFQANVPDETLFSVERASRQLVTIIDSLQPDETGSFFAWDRSPIPW